MNASKHGLSNLTAIIDYNKLQSYGPTEEVQDLEPLGDKWRSFGFGVQEVDGHNVKALRSVFAELPFEDGRPNAVICHTVKCKGIPFAEGDPTWHHKSKLSDHQLAVIYAELGA